MTPRERILAAINRRPTDCIPCCPDFSNMIPCRLTDRPFWDMYLFNDPPMWQVYIDCAKYFNVDAMMDCHMDVLTEIDGKLYGGFGEYFPETKQAIIRRDPDRIYTQYYMDKDDGSRQWFDACSVYYIDNPPNMWVPLAQFNFPDIPESYEDVTPKEEPKGEELLKMAKEYMGDQGIVGTYCGVGSLVGNEEQLYDYLDNPEKYTDLRDRLIAIYKKRFDVLMSWDTKPDFIATGSSGTLVFQTVDMFKELGLPIIKNTAAMCKQAGIPSHVHSCGPETAVIELCATQTDLSFIDPLELPPMGDCDLARMKEQFGDKIVLKGNLHTTNVMLFGTVDDVEKAARQAIDDAGEGGGFILSTGDQCGRDTPDENIFKMIEVARTYGQYDENMTLIKDQ